jgi:hypothetical protein
LRHPHDVRRSGGRYSDERSSGGQTHIESQVEGEMMERTVEIRATLKQADLLAWASAERQAGEAERARQRKVRRNRRSGRAALAGMLMALAAWLISTDTPERGSNGAVSNGAA